MSAVSRTDQIVLGLFSEKKADGLTNDKFYYIMKLPPNWSAEHCIIAIIYILAQDGVPGNAKDKADVHDQASMALGWWLVISFWSSWPGEFIFPSFTLGVFFLYPTNQLPDAVMTKLISGVSFGSWGLLRVVIRTNRRAEAGDILNDTWALASALVAKPLGAAMAAVTRWWQKVHSGEQKIWSFIWFWTRCQKGGWLTCSLHGLITQTKTVLF